MTSCIVEKKIGAVGPGPYSYFPLLFWLMAIVGVLVSICSLHGLVVLLLPSWTSSAGSQAVLESGSWWHSVLKNTSSSYFLISP